MGAGRPKQYETADQLQDEVDSYFENLEASKETATITGLAYYLGFESRQSFYDYEKREDFSYTIKRARLRVEKYYEGKLISNGAAGSIFALKNMGWKDQHDITGNFSIEQITGMEIEK